MLTNWSVFPIAGCNPVAIIKWGGWQVVRFYHASPILYPARLLARSSPFQGEGTGSIPVQDTKYAVVVLWEGTGLSIQLRRVRFHPGAPSLGFFQQI